MNRLRALVDGNADGVVDIVRRDGFFFSSSHLISLAILDSGNLLNV